MSLAPFIDEAASFIIKAGYKPENIVRSCAFTARSDDGLLKRKTIDLAAFAHPPHDIQSSCIVAIDGTGKNLTAVLEDIRFLGAPVALAGYHDRVELWPISKSIAQQPIDTLSRSNWTQQLSPRLAQLSPSLITEAKRDQIQLEFVDAGLGIWTTNIASQSLKLLLESLIDDAIQQLPASSRRRRAAQDAVLRLIFHLFACRALQDKNIIDQESTPRKTIEAAKDQFSESFSLNVLKSPDIPKELPARVFERLVREFSFETLTTEILGYAYENALVTPALRKQLGIYYTPRAVTEYVLKRLPIESIAQEKRVLCDPCCGCGSFLLAGFYRLASMLPEDWSPHERHRYLRARIIGYDLDPFAQELAGLSLILADLHNRNGWKINECNVTELQVKDFVSRPTIMVTNPPFREIKEGKGIRRELSAEVLERLIALVADDGLLGVVLPQSVLDSTSAKRARRAAVTECEVLEVAMLPGGLFESQAETAILMLRKNKLRRSKSTTVRELRSADLPQFTRSGSFTRTYPVDSSQWSTDTDAKFIISPLVELWTRLESECVSLGDVAEVRNGLQVKKTDTTSVTPKKRSDKEVPFVDRLDVLRPFALLTENGLRPTKWLRYGTHLHRAREPDLFDSSKVLINSNRNPGSAWRLVAAVSRQPLYFSDNFHGVIPKDERVTVEQLAAVLNSPIGNAWFDSHCRKRKVVQSILRQLPFPRFENRIGEMLNAVVRQLEQGLVEKWKRDSEGLFYDGMVDTADTVTLLNIIDSLVYDAYGLSEMERRHLDKLMATDRRPR